MTRLKSGKVVLGGLLQELDILFKEKSYYEIINIVVLQSLPMIIDRIGEYTIGKFNIDKFDIGENPLFVIPVRPSPQICRRYIIWWQAHSVAIYNDVI